MTSGQAGVVRDLHTIFSLGAVGGLSDRQLLERFGQGDRVATDAAFTALVERHGPMVLRVCRALLCDEDDAQDAFQATFLILWRKVGSIRNSDVLGSWLHGVALRVSTRSRTEMARRRAADRRAAVVATVETGDEAPFELQSLVHEEVGRLPEKYRAPVVLCYLEGLTHDGAAEQLGWPVGTVRGRLARARDRLRTRLTRRGLALPAGLVAAGVATKSAPAIPHVLLTTTIGAAPGAGSPKVMALVDQWRRMMILIRLKRLAAALLAVGVLAAGAVVLARQEADAPPKAGATEKPPIEVPVPQPPYVVEPPDVLLVEILEALPGRPISGERLVRPDGRIGLGFYGEVYVAGLTLPEIKKKVIDHLRKHLPAETLGLIDEKGRPVPVEDNTRILVDVTAYNSKVYYVEGEVAQPGRRPITGNETVLDGIHGAGGLTPVGNPRDVRLLRRGSPGTPIKTLSVDYDEITVGTDPSTNYTLMPGDRLVVGRDRSKPPPDRPTEGSELRGLEERLGKVERKLDQVLDALKGQDHRGGR